MKKEVELLESQKSALGIEDLKEFRRKTWDIAYEAIMEEAKEAIESAERWEMALSGAELVEMLAEKAWSAASDVAFGPVGALVSKEVYKCVTESVKTIGEKME